MSPSHRRGPWIPEEDAHLLQLVRSQGPNNWVRISQLMHYRSPKQCRERFHQNLKPSLNHEPISPDEGVLIERMVHEMGKRWAEIARRLGNRSDNAVKNWWNGSMNRRRRVNSHPESRLSMYADERSHPRPVHPSYHHVMPSERSWHSQPQSIDVLNRGPAPQMQQRPPPQLHISSAPYHSQAPSPSTYDPRRRPPPLHQLSSPHQIIEASVVSPVYSEYSNAPPSMVSDHNSVTSVSPKSSYSPRNSHFSFDSHRHFSDPRIVDTRRESDPPATLPPMREDRFYQQMEMKKSTSEVSLQKSPLLNLAPGSVLPMPQVSANRQSPMRLTSLLN